MKTALFNGYVPTGAVKKFLMLVVIGILTLPPSGGAADVSSGDGLKKYAHDHRQWSMTVRWENDWFGGSDRFYTNGVYFSLDHTGSSWLDPLVDLLPWGQVRRTTSYDIAQIMVTPADTGRSVPDPNDRPYVGILSFGLTLHIENPGSYHGLKLFTGVVGPWSFAGETQNEIHRFVATGQSEGWAFQLGNEPILNLAYEYRHKFYIKGSAEGWSVELLPIVSGWLGNVITQGQVGGWLRAGYNIPGDFGPALVRGMGHLPPPPKGKKPRSTSDWGFSLYCGGAVSAVLRDITLDGNTFTDSPRLEKNLLVSVIGMGLTVGNQKFWTSFTYVYWGNEFRGQKDPSRFGSISLSYLF